MTKKFADLRFGDIVQTEDGRTARVMSSAPDRGVIRGRLGVELRIIGGELTWSEMAPDATVFLA